MSIIPSKEKEELIIKFTNILENSGDTHLINDCELMVQTLKTENSNLLDSMSLDGCAYFFRFVKPEYFYEKFIGIVYEIFESNKNNIKSTYIRSRLLPSELLNDEYFFELINSLDDEIFNEFYNYKFDNTSLDMLSKILKRLGLIDCNFFSIQCDSKKSFIAQNSEYSKMLVTSPNFVKLSHLIEPVHMKKIFSNNKSFFLNFL